MTLVDCGYGDATTRAHWQRHFETTLARRPIRSIVATHYHPDHLGNAAWLAARFGCTVAMTHGEFLAAHALIEEHAGFGAGGRCTRCSRGTAWPPRISPRCRGRGNHYRRGVPEAAAHVRATDRRRQARGRTAASGR